MHKGRTRQVKGRVPSSSLESLLDAQIKAADLLQPKREFRFHSPGPGEKKRQWRFDRAWPKEKLAVEVEGGIWAKGRHIRPAGFHADTIKYNTALLQGWRVLRFTGKSIKDGSAIKMIEIALEGMRSDKKAGQKEEASSRELAETQSGKIHKGAGRGK